MEDQQYMTDEQAFASPKAESTEPQFMTDEEAWTPAPVQIKNKENTSKWIGRAFNQGLHESTQGYEDLGFSQETQDEIRKSKIYEGSGLIGQALWDQVVTPATMALDATMRTAVAPFTAGGQVLQEAARQRGGMELDKNHPLATALGAAGEVLENIPQGGLIGVHAPSVKVPEFSTQDLLKAKAAGVLDGDKAYFTGETTPEQAKEMDAAAQAISEPEPAPPTVKPIEDQRQFIMSDVKQKIMAAGRPEEEADAVSQLEASRYQTLSEQYPKFSAEEWYSRESADIKSGRGQVRARELAQPFDASLQESMKANLSANTSSIEHLNDLAQRANAGDGEAGKLLNTIANDSLSNLINKIPGASLETTSGSGLYGGYLEPSLGARINFNAESHDQVLGALAKFADTFKQQQIHVRREAGDPLGHVYSDGSYVTPSYTIDIKEPLTREQVQKIIADSGLYGLTYNDKQLEAYYVGDPTDAKSITAFEDGIKRAKESLGANGGEVGRSSQRLWAYGEGEGATTGYEAIRGQLPEAEKPVDHQELYQFGDRSQEAYAQKLGRLSNIEGQIKNEYNPDKIADLQREKQLIEKHIENNPVDLEQKAKGKIKLATDESKATITLMKTADASTLIHEKGHEWTDQLLRLADQEDAPSRMKADAETLRKYGGADEDGVIPTKGHERIARTFERWIKDGQAPSPELASVFHKLAAWLTKIYQAVKGMDAPISDDIREVFERLLASKPDRQPRAEPGAMLADLHETDAKTTQPENAARVADHIRDEVKSTAKQHDKDVHDALTSAEEAGASEGDGEGVEPTAPIAANAEPSTVPAGGTVPAPESNAARGTADAGREASERGGNAAGKPETEPTKPLGKPESNYVDKAGNIRLENLTDNEDVREAMRQMARDNNDFWGARGGVVSDQAVSALADAMGIPERELNIQKLRQISLEDGVPLAVRIKVGRQMLVQSAKSARDAMAAAVNGGEEELIALAEARRKHLMIQETIHSITAEWGRAGRAFRDISKEDAEGAQDVTELFQRMTGMSPRQMRELAKKGASLDTPQQIAKFLKDSTKPSFGEMILEYWINGLISGPATHTTYMVGNALLALWRGIPETAVASAISKIRGGDAIPETAINSTMSRISTILGNTGIQAEEVAAKIKAIKESLDHPAFADEIKERVNKVIDEAMGSGPVPKADFKVIQAKIQKSFGKSYSGVRFAEIMARPKAAVNALPTALSATGKALKTGVTTLLPGEDAASMPFQFGAHLVEPGKISNTDVTWKQLGADAYGTMQGMRDAFIGIGQLVKNGGVDDAPVAELVRKPLGSIPNVAVKGIEIPVGGIIRVPGRAIAAIHSFFRTMNYSMEKAALAYRTAADEGLTDKELSERIGDMITNPTLEQMKEARGEATELTLMGQGGQFTKMLSRITNAPIPLPLLGQTRLLKFIDPFVHISSNIIEQSILERTPLGLLSPEIRADLAGVNGASARDFAAARMLVGSALMVTVGGLTAQGYISGGGPSDYKEAAAWRMLGGNQAHSVLIGDTWYDIHRLGPIGMIVSVAADLYEIGDAITEGEAAKVSSMLIHAVTENILEESWFRGPAELIKAITDHDRYGEQYIRNMMASFTPFSVGMSQVARAIDPYSRQARSVMDAIKAKIPYVSEELYPRRDIWGEPIANKAVLGPAGFSALYEKQVSTDPVNQRLLALKIFPSHPKREILGVKLTDQQYDDYCRIAGRTAKLRLDPVVSNPAFQRIPEAMQVEIINKTIATARKMAGNIIQMQNPAMIKEATEAKIAKKTGAKIAQ